MSVRIRSIWAAVLAAASFQATALADVIFDNSSGAGTGITTTIFPQLGGEVTAAPGTSRTVTELDLGFTSQGLPATTDLQAFLYANDGSGGSPGTLLWQSALMSGVNVDSTNVLIAFAVPSVVVPDTFSFAAAITNPSPLVGYVPASGATTARSSNHGSAVPDRGLRCLATSKSRLASMPLRFPNRRRSSSWEWVWLASLSSSASVASPPRRPPDTIYLSASANPSSTTFFRAFDRALRQKNFSRRAEGVPSRGRHDTKA
jgi:hypothetical protein